MAPNNQLYSVPLISFHFRYKHNHFNFSLPLFYFIYHVHWFAWVLFGHFFFPCTYCNMHLLFILFLSFICSICNIQPFSHPFTWPFLKLFIWGTNSTKWAEKIFFQLYFFESNNRKMHIAHFYRWKLHFDPLNFIARCTNTEIERKRTVELHSMFLLYFVLFTDCPPSSSFAHFKTRFFFPFFLFSQISWRLKKGEETKE